MKKFLNNKRLTDALINFVCNDQLDELRYYCNLYGGVFKNNKKTLLFQAINHNSKRCAEWLFENGEYTNLRFSFLQGKYDKILESYNFLKEFSEKYDIPFSITKETLISRILSVDKVENNSKRIDYIFHLINEGFVTYQEVRNVLDKDYAQENKRLKVIALLRELRLTELGI